MLTGASYVSMFFLGVGTAVIGAASGSIGLAPSQTGLLISAQSAGFIVSILAAGGQRVRDRIAVPLSFGQESYR